MLNTIVQVFIESDLENKPYFSFVNISQNIVIRVPFSYAFAMYVLHSGTMSRFTAQVFLRFCKPYVECHSKITTMGVMWATQCISVS